MGILTPNNEVIINWLALKSLLVGVGDNPPLAPPPPRRGIQETGVRTQVERGIIEEVGRKVIPRLFCHNRPKILACMSFLHQKACTFFDQKRPIPISINGLKFNQQALIINY
ncbi:MULTISPECIES: hypothetical protein [Okeania]|uniref:Uncharacterized protein n=1 Tax=Okeania hirsuta TaxID=1458930 RepID=A0A3N6PC27_9CYAN|nr:MULTISPECIES: hypothetical protein [Okeania]NES91174.1 hypothetical protein [Okeania sp. SIO2B9]NET15124.1 hypothetical protein [Okeania sp. SIO1H6]NEP71633.1 hypothetical protein [Okeania sp. SIO2G5]NEP91728.1 hypothetical protein [Okeania sp. SIO2F5]NEQ89555.1 hypothetical protein [Okeania sp. SIO2G4]